VRRPLLGPNNAAFGFSSAIAINNNGYIAGMADFHGIVWKPDGTIIDLGEGAIPRALNDKNQVAGGKLFCFGFDCTVSPAIWDLAREIKVTVQVTPERVDPVSAQCFDATTQTVFANSLRCVSDTVVNVTRRDVAQVRVVATSGGSPVQGATVQLSAEAVAGSGGHLHGDAQSRPVGTFFDAGANPNVDAGNRGSTAGRTGSDGTASFQYVTSGVGGLENLLATVSLSTGETGKGQGQIRIQVAGLVEIPRAGHDYVFKAGTDTHPQNNFGTAQLRDAAIGCFGQYLSDVAAAELDPFLVGGSQFVVTEVGLPSGGLLDLDADWTPPHQIHRFGRHMDLRSQSGGVQLFDPSRFDVLRDACRNLRLGVVTESNHLHLSLGAS
jgi:hypothetical protein